MEIEEARLLYNEYTSGSSGQATEKRLTVLLESLRQNLPDWVVLDFWSSCQSWCSFYSLNPHRVTFEHIRTAMIDALEFTFDNHELIGELRWMLESKGGYETLVLTDSNPRGAIMENIYMRFEPITHSSFTSTELK